MTLKGLMPGFSGRGLAALVLGALLTLASGVTILAQNNADLQKAEKIKAKVREIGVNEKKRVEVKLKSDVKFKGSISSIENDSFTVTDAKTGSVRTVSYTDVKDVRKSGGISPLTWGIIAGVAAAAVIVSVTVLYPVLCDGGAGC